MQDCCIEEGVELEYVVCDKNVKITQGKSLKGSLEYPLVIKKGKIINF